MTFQNLALPVDTLPTATGLEFAPMAPNYPREVLVQSLLSWGIVILIALIPVAVVAKPPALRFALASIPAAALFLATLSTWLSLKGAKVKGYVLREHDIAFRRGLIFRKATFLAFNRIQHIELSQGPLQRRFGLATLKFFTAGGLSVDMKIDGLRREDAQKLRQLILSKIGRQQKLQ